MDLCRVRKNDRSASDLTRLDLCFAQGLQGKKFCHVSSVAVK